MIGSNNTTLPKGGNDKFNGDGMNKTARMVLVLASSAGLVLPLAQAHTNCSSPATSSAPGW